LKRNVKGVLFADYVRMIRSQKGVDWAAHLPPEDLAYLGARVRSDEWYPMATFERMGNAILRTIARSNLEAVRMWGRLSVDQLAAAQPALIAARDPVETLVRFRVLRASYFDFEALEIPMLVEDQAHVEIRYHMGKTAEEAASYQTMGFFERLLEAAGATAITSLFLERSWAGDARTRLELNWVPPRP
jgi:hypothetical protein